MGLFSRPSPKLEAIEADLEGQARRVRDVLRDLNDVEAEIRKRFNDLEERIGLQEKAVRLMVEEMEERIDRGNTIWRKIRASEYYEEKRREGEEESDAALDLFGGDGVERAHASLPPMHRNLGSPPVTAQKAREVAQAIARGIIGT